MSLESGVVAENRYGLYAIPNATIHRDDVAAVANGGVWEQETIECMLSYAGDGDIVHAGADFGGFLPALSQIPGKVWAFEPSPNFRFAQETVVLNDLKNVELSHKALSNEEGVLPLVFKHRGGVHLGSACWVSADETTHHREEGAVSRPVEAVALDDVIPVERKISVIQLDLEGWEPYALAGAMGIIRRCEPVIIVAPEGAANEKGVTDLGHKSQTWLDLWAMGYSPHEKINGNHVVRLR